MPNLKKISGTLRQESIKKGVDENIFARAQDVNPLIDLFNNLELKNYPDDLTAAAAGVKLGDFYHTAGVVKIRLT
jgi:hypothetical protein